MMESGGNPWFLLSPPGFLLSLLAPIPPGTLPSWHLLFPPGFYSIFRGKRWETGQWAISQNSFEGFKDPVFLSFFMKAADADVSNFTPTEFDFLLVNDSNSLADRRSRLTTLLMAI